MIITMNASRLRMLTVYPIWLMVSVCSLLDRVVLA